MKYFAILPLLLITAVLWSQPIDNKRMKRDIEVAENIIAALIEDDSPNNFTGIQVEGTYLESYGVLFSFQSGFSIRGFASAPLVIWDGQRATSDQVEARARGEARSSGRLAPMAQSINSDSLKASNQKKLREVAETFLAEYSYLLTQLPNNEKICIKSSEGVRSNFFGSQNVLALTPDSDPNDNKVPGFTMVVSKKVVEDHRTGKIDRKKLISQIEYTENKVTASEEDREFVLLNSIFNRAYQSDLSEGFFMRGKGNMERIPGLGLLFSYRFSTHGNRSSFYINSGDYRLYFPNGELDRGERARGLGRVHQRDRTDDEEEDMDEEEEPDFDEFLDGFKSNVIEYGSTVRSLKPEEVLSFELSFPDCEDCDRPELVKITAKQSLLDQYRKGTIDLEDAKEKLQVMIIEE